MIRTSIYINNQAVDITQDIPFVLNYQISDIRNPESRKTDTSYTVTVQGSKSNNKLFSHIFDISKEVLSEDLTINFTPDFNPNLKSDAKIYVDNIQVFSGYAKLEEVINIKGQITYNLSFKGSLGSIFNKIKGLKLTDLDLQKNLIWLRLRPNNQKYQFNNTVSASNITLVNDTISNFAINELQFGTKNTYTGYTYYTYPLIDKGNQVEGEFEMNTVYPAWSLYSYIRSIFDIAGYKFRSNFFRSDFFLNLYVPYLDNFVLNSNEATKRETYISTTTNSVTTKFGTYNRVTSPQYLEGGKINDVVVLNLDDNSSLPYFLGDYNTFYNKILTIAKQGYYTFDYNLSLTIPNTFLVDGVSCYVDIDQNQSGGYLNIMELRGYRDINGVSTPYGRSIGQTGYNFRGGNTVNVNLNIPNYSVDAGKQYYIQYSIQVTGAVRRVSDNVAITGILNKPYTYTLNNSVTSLSVKPVTTLIFSGDTYVLNSYIPQDVLCSDLLLSTIKLFNIQIDIDKDDASGKRLIVEPFNDFYKDVVTGDAKIIDWNNKLDTNKQISFKPASEINGKTYTFTYTSDDDYYNKAYSNIFNNEVYGQKTVDIKNDFVSNDNKVEVIFSPLLPVKFSTTNLVAPRVYDADENGNISSREKNNIRLLYCGNKTQRQYTIVERSQNGTVKKTNYNVNSKFFGHTDNITNPSFDILFGTPRQVFWSNVGSYTDNNLYNKYYKNYIESITSKDSKVLSCYINLSPLDIANFSFRNFVQVMGQNFRVNKIINYNPLSNDSTQVELFKLVNESDFIPSQINLERESVNPSAVNYIIDAGVDTVRSPLATSPYNLVNCGLDEVRGIGSMSSTSLIDGGQDTI